MKTRLLLALATLALAPLFVGPAHAAAQTCDRTCLTNLADTYVAALVALDPAKATIVVAGPYDGALR